MKVPKPSEADRERPMAGYVTLPAGWTSDQARSWIDRSLEYVAALPAKRPKASKPQAKR